MDQNKNTFWTLPAEGVIELLGGNVKAGLTKHEAQRRIEQFGYNVLPKAEPISPIYIFLSQFSSIITITLLVALFISAALGEYIDAIAIIIILILNATIGFIQEYSAEKSLEQLKKLITATSVVLRDGQYKEIDVEELVPGDIIQLHTGDKVPVDGRIINASNLVTEEAALTGESTPVHKISEPIKDPSAPVADRKNMVFTGTLVSSGKALIIATATGAQTQLGTIAQLLKKEKPEQTSFQKELARLEKKLVFFCIIVALTVFAIGLFRGFSLFEIILTSLSLAVASIPEGLPVVTTIALAFGIQRMARRQVLIRKLPTVETLGSTSVICTDKTGTLTENKMVATTMWLNEQFIQISGSGYEQAGVFTENNSIIDVEQSPNLLFALKIGVLVSGAQLTQRKEDPVVGDPTEGALLIMAAKAGLRKQDLEKQYKLIKENPFDSTRKRASSLREDIQNNEIFLFAQGAPERIIEKSSHIKIDNSVITFDAYKQNIENILHDFAQQGLRVLALAYKKLENKNNVDDIADLENNLIFVGLVGIMDPAREEVSDAIQKCQSAGIKVVMITGDHKETATAIAKHLDIYKNGDYVLTGNELEEMNDEQFQKIVQKVTVYARTTPAQKIKIVKAWKALGNIVAMTGDGVNDAPALKAADIGIAMGTTGTEVTKEASDMILLDDNFKSIVNAVEEGRTIYTNIVKFVEYIFASNLSEVLIIIFDTIVAVKDPSGATFVSLLPIQILWLNFVTDGPPAISLTFDPVSKAIMRQPPRDPKQPILTPRLIIELIIIAITLASGTLFTSHLSLKEGILVAHTMAFTQLVVLEFVRLYMVRKAYNLSFFSNKWLIIALASSFVLQLLVVYVPFLQPIFKTTYLGFNHWVLIALVALSVFVVNNILFYVLQTVGISKNKGH